MLLAVVDSHSLLAAVSLATACAVLSVFVVARRWALLGEGIGHAGFGGAGIAWALAAYWPNRFDNPQATYLAVTLACLLAAVVIGWIARDGAVSNDVAIGIFLVAALAVGFVGQQVYVQRYHRAPGGFDTLLFGHIGDISPTYAVTAALAGVIIIGTLYSLGKEFIAYSFDPLIARMSGIRVELIHNLLMLLVALAIVIGTRIIGTVLITALLILPGAIAGRLTNRLTPAFVTSLTAAVAATLLALVASTLHPALPAGPVLVLLLFVTFLVATIVGRRRRNT